jgi:very-short-patch-repair endonuclease
LIRFMDEKFIPEDTITPYEEVLAKLLTENMVQFERQYEIKRDIAEKSYWLDFAIPGKKIAIEIDGHPINLAREAYLIKCGWTTIHFQNEHFASRKTSRNNFEYILDILRELGLRIPKLTIPEISKLSIDILHRMKVTHETYIECKVPWPCHHLDAYDTGFSGPISSVLEGNDKPEVIRWLFNCLLDAAAFECDVPEHSVSYHDTGTPYSLLELLGHVIEREETK